MPITSLVGHAFVVTVLPYACLVNREANKFRERINGKLCTKCERKQFRSFDRLGVSIGFFGLVNKVCVVTIVNNLISYTASALLTLK